MGIFSPPDMTPPPPPPIPPAANPPTFASGEIAKSAASAKSRAHAAEGAGFNGTDLTQPGVAAPAPTAAMALAGK